jgi:hypothetical protein
MSLSSGVLLLASWLLEEEMVVLDMAEEMVVLEQILEMMMPLPLPLLFVLIFQFEFYLLLLSMHAEILVTCINFKLF